MTPDPYGGSARSGSPLTWNRYSYVMGDPVNHSDRRGLDCDPYSGDPCNDESNGIGNSVSSCDDTCIDDEYYAANPTAATPVSGDNTAPPTFTVNSCTASQVWDDDTQSCQDVSATTNSNQQGPIDPTGPTIAAGNGGPQTPQTPQTCTAQTVVQGLVSIGLDAIPLIIPEGSLVSNTIGRAIGNYAGWTGVVATQQGVKTFGAVSFAGGIVRTGLGMVDTSGAGVAGAITGVGGIFATIAGLTPLGQMAAAASVIIDAANLYNQCH